MRAGPSVGLPLAFGDLLLEDTDHTGEFPGVFRVGGRENFMGLENVSGTVLKVESIPVQASRSITRHRSPAAILDSAHSFIAGLVTKEPFPSHRIQVNPSKTPTSIAFSELTREGPNLLETG